MYSVSDSKQKTPDAISGIDVMRGVGAQPAKAFWADAWERVLKNWGARIGLFWIGVVAFFAVFSPIIANGLPLWTLEFKVAADGAQGDVVRSWSPLWEGLSSIDVMLVLGTFIIIPWMLIPESVIRIPKGRRLGLAIYLSLFAGTILVISWFIAGQGNSVDGLTWFREANSAGWLKWGAPLGLGVILALILVWLPAFGSIWIRGVVLGLLTLVITGVVAERWNPPIAMYDRFIEGEDSGRYENIYTIIPWSPYQSRTDLYEVEPGNAVGDHLQDRIPSDSALAGRVFILGTDSLGQDVLSQMMYACRLSISIGLISTGISVFIGIVIGSLMGYFGGWVDMLLSRVLEVFMGVPVLFLLIVAAAVLPRNTYMMMAIIGFFTWTLTARFIRAEFLKLRNQDFVQAAHSSGLPLRSVLFKHMLPNGVTPVLVQASFAIASAILFESYLSFLGLGPIDQASWGKLLASATGSTGTFIWWLAVFPGLAIFLTVLSYNLLGEAFRDAIDPKLRKAAH